MAAICNCEDTCLGLRLVGVDSHFAATEEELPSILANLRAGDIKVMAISEELAAADSFAKFEQANPQILVATV